MLMALHGDNFILLFHLKTYIQKKIVSFQS
jgi:hypothetical protein